MFTKFIQRVFSPATATANTTASTASTSGRKYAVTIPGQQPVVLRASNKVEVKSLVREANGFSRLPAGTVVERVD